MGLSNKKAFVQPKNHQNERAACSIGEDDL